MFDYAVWAVSARHEKRHPSSYEGRQNINTEPHSIYIFSSTVVHKLQFLKYKNIFIQFFLWVNNAFVLVVNVCFEQE